MTSEHATDGIFLSANWVLLRELELLKIKDPGGYAGAVKLAERINDYYRKVSGINELDPVPKY